MISRSLLHGFVEIEMDHIRFHLESVDGFFTQVCMRQIILAIAIPWVGPFRRVMMYTLLGLSFFRFFDKASFETHKEFYWFRFFNGFYCDTPNFDSLISIDG